MKISVWAKRKDLDKIDEIEKGVRVYPNDSDSIQIENNFEDLNLDFDADAAYISIEYDTYILLNE